MSLFLDKMQANLASGDKPDFLTLLDSHGEATRYSYLQIVSESLQWNEYFCSVGVGLRDRIIIILPHSLPVYTSYLGGCIGGHSPSFLHFPSAKYSKSLFAETIAQLIQDNGAALVLTYLELKQDLCKILGSGIGPTIVAVEEIVLPANTHLSTAREFRDKPLFIQYSSGTTGMRKGVGITDQDLDWQIKAYSKHLEIDSRDTIVSWLPLYHDMGLITSYFIPLLTKTRLVAMSPFDWVRRPRMLFDAIKQYQGTLCWLPNFAYFHLANAISDTEARNFDLSSLRYLMNCSEPVTKAAHDLFLNKFGAAKLEASQLGSTYAMAEATFAVTSTSPSAPMKYDYIDEIILLRDGRASAVSTDNPKAKVVASSGIALQDTRIRIVDSQGVSLEDRIVGEITVSSPSVVSGYLSNDERANDAFCNDWFSTGDLGYMADGHLYVTGRKKDLIIINGKNIYPHDIEELLGQLAGTTAGRIVAVGRMNDHIGTEDLFILAESNCTSPEDRKALSLLIAQTVSAKTEVSPRQVAILPPQWLRKSTSGKLARKANLEQYLKENPQFLPNNSIPQHELKDLTLDKHGIRAVLEHCIDSAALLHLDSFDNNTKLISSGIIDSLGLVMFIVALEDAFHISIPASAHADFERHFDSVGSVITLVRWLQTGEFESRKMQANPLTGHPPAMPAHMSDRAFKVQEYLAGDKCADLLFLGNSRCYPMHSTVASEFGFNSYNFAVSNATIPDYYCILKLVLANNQVPLRRILIALEPNSFNWTDPRLMKCPELCKFIEDCNIAVDPPDPPIESKQSERERLLLKRQKEFDRAVEFYTYSRSNGDQIGVTDRPVDLALNARTPWNYSTDADDYRSTMTMMYGPAACLNMRAFELLINLVAVCEANDIRIDFFHPPFHHSLLDFAATKTKFIILRNEMFQVFANTFKDLRIHDFLFPISFAGSDEDFSDAGHLMAFNADQIVRKLLRISQFTNLNRFNIV